MLHDFDLEGEDDADEVSPTQVLAGSPNMHQLRSTGGVYAMPGTSIPALTTAAPPSMLPGVDLRPPRPPAACDTFCTTWHKHPY